ACIPPGVSVNLLGSISINNLAHSPFGAGWSLDGVAHLYPQKSGQVLLTEGDGATRVFTPAFGTRFAGDSFSGMVLDAARWRTFGTDIFAISQNEVLRF